MTANDSSPRRTHAAAPAKRRQAVSLLKRSLILDAARAVFESDGLEGASLRSIAKAAGYTPAALYFHFPSKEAVYAALLADSLDRLKAMTEAAAAPLDDPAGAFRAAGLAFFAFYAENPGDLDLGFYLFRGGMKPHGLGRDFDPALNEALAATLAPLGRAARQLGADEAAAERLVAEFFAYAVGVLLLVHTRRIRMFGQDPRAMIERHLNLAVSGVRRVALA
jgi:AcrR family transcriptional regulator